MSAASADLRPARTSAALAVGLGLLAVRTTAPGGVETATLVEGAGLAVLALGFAVHQRGWSLLGLPVVLAGAATALGSSALVWTTTGDPITVAEFAPGMVGVFALALGVVPARGRGSRRLVQAGAALLLVGALVVGAVERPALGALLWSVVLTVLAWDAGENAISVGTHLGRRARTWPIEGVHAAGAGAVGVVAVLAGRTATGVGAADLGLAEFAVLLIGLLSLAAALHD